VASSALLAGTAVPTGAIAGWANPHDRRLWLAASGACVAAAGLLQLSSQLRPSDPRPLAHEGGRAAPVRDGDQRELPSQAKVWNIPDPVSSFVGRESHLEALQTAMASHRAAALHGLGGVGKTQLALAYTCRHRDRYQLGWWIPAETLATITAALAELAPHVGVSDALPVQELVVRVRAALANQVGWLLVFDNAAGPAEIEPFCPRRDGGHVLVTSRNHAWRGMAAPIPVDVLSLEEAVRLLEQRTGQLDWPAAEALANSLGRLPLALEQAAAYIETQRLPLARYLELFEERRGQLLGRGDPVAYQATVDATFSLAFEALRRQTRPAAQLLVLCALLAPDQLPLDLLLDHSELLPEPLAGAARDRLSRSETIGALYTSSLLSSDLDDTARVHRLVQAVTVHHVPRKELSAWIERAVALMATVFTDQPEEPGTWTRCALLLPHAQAALGHAGQHEVASSATATLLHHTAGYLMTRLARLSDARAALEEALAMRRRLYGDETAHAEIAASLNSLGVVRHTMGDLQGARRYYEHALAMRRRLYGEESAHAEIAASLNNLGRVLRNLGDLQGARRSYEQALAMRLRVYGSDTDHPDTADTMHNLGVLLHGLGDVPGAEHHLEQALAMRHRLHGSDSDHPDIAESLTCLGLARHALGQPMDARRLHEQALAMRHRLYGEESDHPETARVLNHVGLAMHGLGNLQAAQDRYEQALAMRRRLYGSESDHPDTGQSLNNVGAVLHGLGELQGARRCHEQSLAMRRRLYGDSDHPNTAQSLNNLGLVLHSLGEHHAGEAYLQQANAIRKRLGQPLRSHEQELSSHNAALPIPAPAAPFQASRTADNGRR
jgi:tetratricopeptide (TPR) repeat protein